MSDLSYMGGKGYSRGKTGECVNEYTGKANDGALINKGRGPTVGNKGTKSTPGTSSMPSTTKTKNPDYINGGGQVRTPGGTKEFPKRGKESFNYGRGPTKGNE
jgi:hypothetical protein